VAVIIHGTRHYGPAAAALVAMVALAGCGTSTSAPPLASCDDATKTFIAESKGASKDKFMALLQTTISSCANDCDRAVAGSCVLLDGYLDNMCGPGDTIFCDTLCAEGKGSLKDHGCARRGPR
jgi:hypothetical protein